MFVFVVSEPENVVVSMVVVPWFSIAIAPETWSLYDGDVVPIPTLPEVFLITRWLAIPVSLIVKSPSDGYPL